MNTLQKKYVFSDVEKKISAFWNKSEVYKWQDDREIQSFVIDTPPPTISGNFHMGHVFSYCHTDFIARYQRMKGKNVFYPIGFDNNGLPTERLVEKKHNILGRNLDRKEFANKCNEVIDVESSNFRSIMQLMGYSIDWSLEYSTVSNTSSTISQASFIDLYNKGKIYYADTPVIWDVGNKTAISNSEIEEKERHSYIYNIKFEVFNSDHSIIIATTRPELMPACMAVFVNPEDERYKNLIGKKAKVPIFNIIVPILADSDVKQDKGTGAVMCCTYGDLQDITWQKRHNLPVMIIIDVLGKITTNLTIESRLSIKGKQLFKSLVGMKIVDARNAIVEAMKNNILEKKSWLQKVQCAERSGQPIEILYNKQWFIESVKHRKEMQILSDKLNWSPESMKVKLDRWIETLNEDWCISRQRYFGIPIPVWFSKRKNEEGKVILPKINELPVDPLYDLPEGYSREEVIAETSLLDTWATSCISPRINATGLFADTAKNVKRYNKVFPADLRPQSHEIIRTWTFGTLLKNYLHAGSVDQLPWKSIMISGWCVTKNKEKMSKSKGNAISPIQLIEKYGADVLRYWCASARLGSDIMLSEDVMLDGKKFMNKLFNAAKFCLLHVKDLTNKDIEKKYQRIITYVTSTLDLWILNVLDKVNRFCIQCFEKNDYYSAKIAIEDFFKKDFCDIYIEMSKVRVYSGSKDSFSAKYTLYLAFVSILKLLSPFFPYITEELFSVFSDSKNSIHSICCWPKQFNLLKLDEQDELNKFACKTIDALKSVFYVKSSNNLTLKHELKTIYLDNQNFGNCPKDLLSDFQNAACAKEIKIVNLNELDNFSNIDSKNKIKIGYII